jgi:hypothetical protein
VRTKRLHAASEVDLGPTGEDLSDARYKVICPVLVVHLAAGSEVTDLECPHMGPAKRVAVLQNRRRRQPGKTRSGDGKTPSQRAIRNWG